MTSYFDPDLIRAYDVNGPRYTSYPTANLFTESFDPDAYPQTLSTLEQPPLSLYLHVPFCATVCYYCACNKIITNNRKHAIKYLDHLYREMALIRPSLPEGHLVEQLHFGGGTPTYLTDEQFAEVFDHLHRNFQLLGTDERDFSVEIDPRTVDPDRIRMLTGHGINRVSLGIQDFDPDVQLAVNRLQSEEDTARIIEAARDNGVKSVSVDLIYGLPLQHTSKFSRTLERVIGIDPDRISLYSYAHLPHRFKTQKQIKSEQLPSPEEKLNLLQLAIETLSDAGYQHIGMDHFAKPTDELVLAQHDGTLHRNFQGYTTHGHCDLIGLGVSAISSVGNIYAQNAKTLESYYESIDSNRLPIERGLGLTEEDMMIRDLIGTLMCHFKLDIPAFERRWHIDFAEEFAHCLAGLQNLKQDGLLQLDAERLEVTEKGRFLIRNVCMPFDRYLPAQTTGFSRAI